jgi:HTH-type transcriptional regulator/antitoxin HigA
MELRPIRTTADYDRALEEIQRLWHAAPGTADAEKLEMLGALVEAYEQDTYPMPAPDPIEAIKFRMDQQGLSQADLVPIFGTRARVSEILGRKRALTLEMIRRLHHKLHIPLESLVSRPGRPRRSSRRSAAYR